MIRIALFEPCIPANTGNIIRLSANTGCELHLIEPLGFDMDEKKLRRAGLDYSEFASVQIHPNFSAFKCSLSEDNRIFAITTKGEKSYTDIAFQAGDTLLFGAETHGLTEDVRQAVGVDNALRIPMLASSRSLNLSNSVALVAYEALRQIDFPNMS